MWGVLIEVQLLGHFSVRRAGEEIPPAAFRGRLARTLVRILITRRGTFVPRDVLIEALWPATLPANPDLNLNVIINRARRALEDPSLILTGPRGYSFADSDRCLVDAEVFLARVESGRERLAAGQTLTALREFRAALEVWRGEALPEDAYDDWAQEYRSRLSRTHLEALEGAARAALDVGDPGHALAFAELATQREPLREASHLLVAEALAACGDTAGALIAFHKFRRLLAAELGLDPSPQALEFEGRILRSEKVGPSLCRPAALPAEHTLGELTFVGRDEDLQDILGVVEPPVQGIAVVSGPTGAGKSRLLVELARHARVPVISARAFQADREEAWALGRALLRDALSLDLDMASAIPERAAQALADIIPELQELRSLAAAPLDAESRGALAIQGAASLLEVVASRSAMILVDDLQWADPTTLRLLRELVRRSSRVGLVFAYRPDEDILHKGLISAFLKDLDQLVGRVSRRELSALSGDAIARLIDDEELAKVIAEETDCSPLAITEVVRALAAEGLIEPNGLGGWRPRSVRIHERARRAARAGQRRAVRARIERHSPERRELLGLLALVGGETPARVLAIARRTEQQAILDDLDALARAGLVRLGDEGWATAHDVIGESMAEGLDRAERGRLHEMLARALSTEGGDPSEIARHLLGAGDREAAAEVFAQAGRRSLDRFASGEAERLADAGIQLEPGSHQRSCLLKIRAEARFRRGDLHGARADLQAVLAMMFAGPERSRVLARMAMLISGSEDPAQASELIELALVEAGSLPQARAEALAVGSILDTNTNRLERAEARAAEARALFEQLGDAEGVARTLEAEAMAVFGRGRIREVTKMLDRVARLFRDAGMLMHVGAARSYRALALVWMGQASQALMDAEEALQLERMLGHREGEVLSLGMRGQALAALGRADEAKRSVEEGLAIARRLGHRELTGAGLIFLGIACQAGGELERAEACFRESLEVVKRMPIFSAWAAACLARLLVARGDLAQAHRYVAQAMAEAGIPLTQYEARLAQAELAVARGDPDALEITAEALALAEGGSHLASAARLRELGRPVSKSARQ